MSQTVMRFFLLAFLSTTVLIGFHLSPVWASDTERESLWLSDTDKSCDNGAVILIHGLNLKPAAMDPLGHKLVDSGLAVYRLALPGHRGEDRKRRLAIKAQDLMQSLEEATTLVRSRCPGPLYAVAFSLGGLLTVVAQAEGEVNFDKMVLIAPAISLKRYTRLVTWLFPFFDVIPSRGPAPYRASVEGTSKALYRALFVLYDRRNSGSHQRLQRPTRIFMNPDDELVSWEGLAEFIVEHDLEVQWSIKALGNDEAELDDFDHLAIDSKTLSPESWRMLFKEIQSFFAAAPESHASE